MKRSFEDKALYKKRYVERLQQDEEAVKEIIDYLEEKEEPIDDNTEQPISNNLRK